MSSHIHCKHCCLYTCPSLHPLHYISLEYSVQSTADKKSCSHETSTNHIHCLHIQHTMQQKATFSNQAKTNICRNSLVTWVDHTSQRILTYVEAISRIYSRWEWVSSSFCSKDYSNITSSHSKSSVLCCPTLLQVRVGLQLLPHTSSWNY